MILLIYNDFIDLYMICMNYNNFVSTFEYDNFISAPMALMTPLAVMLRHYKIISIETIINKIHHIK